MKLKQKVSQFRFAFVLITICFLIIGLFSIQLPQTQAAATGVAYSNDPNTLHFQMWGANPVIWFNNPIGTRFRFCNGGSCTGYAESYTQPQNYGGFQWIFDNAQDGDVVIAQSEASGSAACTIVIMSGYRYCGVGIPDRDGDGIPDVADACPDQGNQGYGIQSNGCPIEFDEDRDVFIINSEAIPPATIDNIDQYPVTVREYNEFAIENELPTIEAGVFHKNTDYVSGLSYIQAKQYCELNRKMLPSPNQIQAAYFMDKIKILGEFIFHEEWTNEIKDMNHALTIIWENDIAVIQTRPLETNGIYFIYFRCTLINE